ncbi:MAG: 5'/3'-nucleotidase SurE [Bacteroidetes bacterium]|nr:MAG: 5'/3'-nucleotidase SurE [Bacteroidota bacterium]
MKILVTNDDGIFAPGIQNLIEVAARFGEVTVVAPDKPQSGMGHAITTNNTLRINKVQLAHTVGAYACTGTPVDCVKMAINVILHEKPDLILSGINHGSNASINVIYSGTMSAAVEGAMEKIPSIGFSLLDHSIDADFSASKHFTKIIIQQVITNGLPENTCLNVNIPKLHKDEIKGIKVCRQAIGNWEEEFEKRTDPSGNEYYWLTGTFKLYDSGDDIDIKALEDGYVSIVPVQFDMTAHNKLPEIQSIFQNV